MEQTSEPRCTTLRGDVQALSCGVDIDRISSLPDDLLGHILSFLSTKDVAATSILSRSMRHVFTLISSLEFNDSPISHCFDEPHLMERFPTFTIFVDSVLQACQSCENLSKFTLRFGGELSKSALRLAYNYDEEHECGRHCFPDMKPSHVNRWICFPLTRRVKELRLRIHVRKPGKLPPAIFTCETLELLKLNVSLGLDEVSIMPSFHLPNLKVFHLCSVRINDDDFLTRLVSSCPSLEELSVRYCCWKHADRIAISSPSLRRLVLIILKFDMTKHSQVVRTDTPNLEEFYYDDHIACGYDIANMNALVKAEIDIGILMDREPTFQSILSLVVPMSNVQHLSLTSLSVVALCAGDLKDQLPMFRNLKCLDLSFSMKEEVLLKFLAHSPLLETLDFPLGLFTNRTVAEADPQYWKTQAIPSCLGSHLKRIVIRNYLDRERELYVVEYLLKNASILEELVICQSTMVLLPRNVDQLSLESTLKNLPRASISCSIRVE